MSTQRSSVLIGRSYTRSRRFPRMFGRMPGRDGGYVPGGPYTLTQGALFLVLLLIVWKLPLFDWLGPARWFLPLSAVFIRRARIESRTPLGWLAGMDNAQLARFAKEIQLEAHTRALPPKVKVLRDAVAKATGHSDGAALAASPGYDAEPLRSGGRLTWNRFDVGNSLEALRGAVKGRSFVHETSLTGLKGMLANGSLASTERHTLMGIQPGLGRARTWTSSPAAPARSSCGS